MVFDQASGCTVTPASPSLTSAAAGRRAGMSVSRQATRRLSGAVGTRAALHGGDRGAGALHDANPGMPVFGNHRDVPALSRRGWRTGPRVSADSPVIVRFTIGG